MGFFDLYNIEEISHQADSETTTNIIRAALTYDFGDLCFYDTVQKKFIFGGHKTETNIPVGIIINQSDDKCIISVANVHYLNADPEKVNSKVNTNMAIWDLFNRYVQAFKQKLPAHKKLKKMFIRPVTVYELELIKNKKELFKEQLKNISSDKDVDIKFLLKFNSGKTMATKIPITNNSTNKTPLFKWGPNVGVSTIDFFDSLLFFPIFDLVIE